jgi:hypothetical protein
MGVGKTVAATTNMAKVSIRPPKWEECPHSDLSDIQSFFVLTFEDLSS